MPMIPATFARSNAENSEEEAWVELVNGLYEFNAVGSLSGWRIHQFKRAMSVIAEDDQWFGSVNQYGLIIRPACDSILGLIDDWKSSAASESSFLNLKRSPDCLHHRFHRSA